MKGNRNILAAGLGLILAVSVWGCGNREKEQQEENVPEFVLTYAENQAEAVSYTHLTLPTNSLV